MVMMAGSLGPTMQRTCPLSWRHLMGICSLQDVHQTGRAGWAIAAQALDMLKRAYLQWTGSKAIGWD